MWSRDPTPPGPLGTRRAGLGASSQRKSFLSTLPAEAQPWGEEPDTNSRRQGQGWGLGGREASR